MPLIVADTTPLNYLVLIEAVEVLPRLYGRVLIPPAVMAELSDPLAPAQVRAWVTQSRSWLHVVPLRAPADASLMHLDPGERDAIALATEQQASLLLMDERDGAAAARARNLEIVGTLAVLDIAAARGWLDLQDMFSRLRQTTFRSPHRLMATMLEQDAQRKKKTKGEN
jgi:predicted nucleic acid-binding protein